LAAIHAFARFLATRDPEQVEEAQRLLSVPIKRGPARAIDYLEGDEIGAMLKAISPQRQDHVRDRALLLTLFNTGARVQSCSISGLAICNWTDLPSFASAARDAKSGSVPYGLRRRVHSERC
jgi:site-specific recombinase XerD